MEFDVLALVLRWLHILAAIAAVGGSIFIRFALLPAVGALPEEQRRTLHEQVRSRWAKIVAASILFLLVSGLINFWLLIEASRDWPSPLPRYYHPLFGVKFLLALVVFFLASALSGRSAALERFRQNARFWLTLNLILAVIIVCLSGVLRMAHVGPNTAAAGAPRTAFVESHPPISAADAAD